MIDTVIFDMGGTLEDICSDEETLRDTSRNLWKLLADRGVETGLSQSELFERVIAGNKRYKAYGEQHQRELKPEEIWGDFGFADVPADKARIVEISEEIAHMWELSYFRRSMRPRVPEMLAGLRSLNLRLGVISNTASLFQVFDTLEEYGIRQYFEDVTLSSITGYRKPHPHIFEVSTRQLRANPARCAYVGDTLTRDVIGPKRAGFGLTFQIYSFLTGKRDTDEDRKNWKPDYLIEDIYDVYPIMKSLLEKA